MKRWSKLQKAMYLVVDKDIELQIHCSVYRMNSQRGTTNMPRYCITLKKEIIFDYPKQFLGNELDGSTVGNLYPYQTEVSDISDIIRDYLDSPVLKLPERHFDRDSWGITDILKASDRRLGRERLCEYFSNTDSCAVRKVLSARFDK